MIEIKKCESVDQVKDMHVKYIDSLTDCIDALIDEVVMNHSLFYDIWLKGDRVGYFCNHVKSGTTYQFYLEDSVLNKTNEIFAFLLEQDHIKKAVPQTMDPLFMSLCMDFQKKVEGGSLMFLDYERVEPVLDGFDNLTLRPGTLDDAKNVEEQVNDFHSGWGHFVKTDVAWVLYQGDDVLLSCGLYEPIIQYPSHRNIGMNVNPDYRKRGIGTYMVCKLKQKCYEDGYTPFAGCHYQNIASRKTLEKAGFRSKHRFVVVEF